MASVPSAGCLLARNQFYRVRMNSESSDSSHNSDLGLPVENEQTHRGLPDLIEKCWWIKNFFHCEQVPCTPVQINISSTRFHEA
ncbi:hypothetical protein GDO86_011023 [Hymenochirus boettgeri]|uniref:Pancreatic progenitor cell differentiation and proliferation factor-like protein n=1 Tax=Hymenochirus boettgeri TaxID=247094 RepID=A0A8T2JHI2_9PIPI|nr:hypothetical protein GDO86_011023 [Hymenochirus boettgeri]